MSNEKIEYLNPDSLHPFEDNPFQSVDENEYNELRDSIMEFGIITPLIVNKSDKVWLLNTSRHNKKRAGCKPARYISMKLLN